VEDTEDWQELVTKHDAFVLKYERAKVPCLLAIFLICMSNNRLELNVFNQRLELVLVCCRTSDNAFHHTVVYIS
jgi:hypothetical protein